jgi:hypothetical protein
VTAKGTTRLPEDEDDGILCIGEGAEEPKHDVLFRVRGTGYEGLLNPPSSVLFRYLNLQRTRGADVALDWALEEILSPAAYKVLMEDEHLGRPDFDAVCDLVRGIIFGRKTVPKSRSRGPSRTSG